MDDADDLEFVDSAGVYEVLITDVSHEEHIYWVRICDLDREVDVEDASIAAALAFHKTTIGTDAAVNEDGCEHAYAYEPFSRTAGEFKWVDISVIKDQDAGAH